MITGILRSRTFLGYGLASALFLAMLIFSFLFADRSLHTSDIFVSHWAFAWPDSAKDLTAALGVVIVGIMALITRIRTRETRPAMGNSQLHMLIFLGLTLSQMNIILTRPDILVATLMTVLACQLLLSTYKQEQAVSAIFHAGLLLGVASLFVGQVVLMLLPLIFSMGILRNMNGKEWMVFLFGGLMTCVFVMMVCIWQEQPTLSFQRVFQSAWLGGFNASVVHAGHLMLIPATILALVGVLGGVTSGTVAERNITLSNVGWAVGVLPLVILMDLDWSAGIILAAFPLSSLMAVSIGQISRWWLADLILLSLLAAPFIGILLPL